MWRPCRLGCGRAVLSVRMRGHEWERVGVHTGRYVRSGERACSLEIAKMIGFSVLPQSPHFPHVRRKDDKIFVDYGSVWRDGSLVGVREQVARELAVFLLEECVYVRTEEAIVGVATEIVFPWREAEKALHRFGGDIEKLDDYYADHVPTRWISATVEWILRTRITRLHQVKRTEPK